MNIDASPWSASGSTGQNIVPDDLFEEPLNLEDRFYRDGYQAGFDHGRLHGLFEGRALGQEKCFELWEEVAYMEGWAELWMESLQGQNAALGRREERALNHAKVLLGLIATFPTSNPTPSTEPAPPSLGETLSADMAEAIPADAATDDQDLTALMSSMRARYKLLCTALGARPRLMAAPAASGDSGQAGQNKAEGTEGAGGAVVEGIEGPMKGVDTRLLRF